MSQLRTRVRTMSPRAADRLIAALALAVAVAASLADPHIRTPRTAVAVLALAVMAAALLWRRTRPGTAFLVAAAAVPAASLLGSPVARGPGPDVVAALLAYALGRYGRGRPAVAAAIGAVALLAGEAAGTATDGKLNEVAFTILIVAALPLAAGLTLRRRADLIAELRVQRSQLRRERDRRVRDAAATERVRIAQELHDVVVHDVSAMVVQAAAAREIVRARPDEAVATIARVEGAGREALDELRRVLGVLRTDDRAMALEPQPSLAQLGALVDDARARGAHVSLELATALDGLPAGLQLGVYRIVQDALGSGGGFRAAVRVGREGREVVVEIDHDGAPLDLDDLTGARQRAALLDGSLDIRPARRGGSRLCARLPLPG